MDFMLGGTNYQIIGEALTLDVAWTVNNRT